jgi:hypothetical protein
MTQPDRQLHDYRGVYDVWDTRLEGRGSVKNPLELHFEFSKETQGLKVAPKSSDSTAEIRKIPTGGTGVLKT